MKLFFTNGIKHLKGQNLQNLNLAAHSLLYFWIDWFFNFLFLTFIPPSASMICTASVIGLVNCLCLACFCSESILFGADVLPKLFPVLWWYLQTELPHWIDFSPHLFQRAFWIEIFKPITTAIVNQTDSQLQNGLCIWTSPALKAQPSLIYLKTWKYSLFAGHRSTHCMWTAGAGVWCKT